MNYVQIDTPKNTVDKSKQNTKKCSSNPQKDRGKKTKTKMGDLILTPIITLNVN